MKRFKRIGALAMAVLMLLSLAACGKKADPAEVVKTATEKANTAESLHGKMTMDMNMTVQDTPVDMKMSMDITMMNKPLKSKITVQTTGMMDMPEVQMYLEETDDGMVMYLYDGSRWNAAKVDREEVAQMDLQANTELYGDYADKFVAAGQETINGVEADRYDCTVTDQDMLEILKASGAMESMDELVGQVGNFDLSKLGGLTISMWVDPESGYPVRYQIDMQEMMTKMLAEIAAASGASASELKMSVGKMLVAVDYSEFNAVEDFEIPAQAS